MLDTLTTTEAARLAAVAPSTIKRWADRGLLPYTRTAGGHRRFERGAVQRLLEAEPGEPAGALSVWADRLVRASSHDLESALLAARADRGSWHAVADLLAATLCEIGVAWSRGMISIAQEHVASARLQRSLGRMGDMIPRAGKGPICVLTCALDDEHTLGLSLAELCLREAGWSPLWLGRRTPPEEVARVLESHRPNMVAITASQALCNGDALERLTKTLYAACHEQDATLVLGGAGAWPSTLPGDDCHRLTSFTEFHALLNQLHRG